MKSVIAIAWVIAAGCGGSKDAPPPAPPIDGLTVIDAGLAPRTQLRYQIAKGTRTPLEVTGDMVLGDGASAAPWPTIVTGTEIVAEEVSPDGAMHVRYTVLSATAHDRPNQLVTAEQMTAPLQLLVGTSIRGTLSPSGVLAGVTVDTGGKQLPPALEAQVSSLTRAFERLVMPLPGEPVGVGALWTFRQPLDQTGMHLLAATTIKVTAISGTTFAIALTSEVSGPDQTVTEGGSKVALKNIGGKMRGTGTIDLARLTLAGELVADLHMDLTSDGQSDRTTMTTTLRLAPKPTATP
ncbi:MAG: hypothetical protein IPQ07_02090 [Myxococcales bacterium]|nr:hypothetical protein [Myxococcales bacterium]